MPRVNFRVTEVNDLSKDGASNKRVVLEARTSNHDGTGYDATRGGAWAGDRLPTAEPLMVDGRLELVVDNVTQAAHFPINSLHAIDFASVPPTQAMAGRDDPDRPLAPLRPNMGANFETEREASARADTAMTGHDDPERPATRRRAQ